MPTENGVADYSTKSAPRVKIEGGEVVPVRTTKGDKDTSVISHPDSSKFSHRVPGNPSLTY